MNEFIYYSSITQTQRRCRVYVSKGPLSHRPKLLIFILHGIGGDENEWLRFGNPAAILDDLVASGILPPLAAVFPNGRACANDAAPDNPFEPSAIEGFARFGDELLNDLVPLAHKTFGIEPFPCNRMLCGLSMGGGQTLNIGLSNPGFFSGIAAFSPAPNTDAAYALAIGKKRLSGDDCIAQGEPPGKSQGESQGRSIGWPKTWLCCGLSDELLHVTRNAEQTLKDACVPAKTEYIEGGHDWNVWTYGLRSSLEFFFKEII